MLSGGAIHPFNSLPTSAKATVSRRAIIPLANIAYAGMLLTLIARLCKPSCKTP